MNISIRDEGKSRYLEIEGDPAKTEKHEIRMLLKNRMERLLPIMIEEADGCYLYRYDVSGLLSLRDAEQDLLPGGCFRALIFALSEAAGVLSDYMLYPENLVLLPETVFFRFETGTVYFTYMPGYRKPVRESLQELMEYLLRIVSPGREEDVLLLYGLYRKSREINVSLGTLAEYWKNADREEDQKDEEKSLAVSEDPEEPENPVFRELGLELPGRNTKTKETGRFLYRDAGEEDEEAPFVSPEESQDSDEKVEQAVSHTGRIRLFMRQYLFEFVLAAVVLIALAVILLT